METLPVTFSNTNIKDEDIRQKIVERYQDELESGPLYLLSWNHETTRYFGLNGAVDNPDYFQSLSPLKISNRQKLALKEIVKSLVLESSKWGGGDPYYLQITNKASTNPEGYVLNAVTGINNKGTLKQGARMAIREFQEFGNTLSLYVDKNKDAYAFSGEFEPYAIFPKTNYVAVLCVG